MRSGILDSIHAFGASTVGGWFLALIAVVLVGSTALIVSRLDDLRSERRIDSLLSRESVFLLNNLLLVGLCFVVFWGTFFPLISEAVTGDKASVGPPWFDRYTVPLALVLVLLVGSRAAARVAPGDARAAAAAVRGPAAAVALRRWSRSSLFTDAAESPPSLVAVRLRRRSRSPRWRSSTCARCGARRHDRRRSRHGAALASVVRRNRRRYGGYLVHLGRRGRCCSGVAASSAFNTQRDVRLAPGQTARVGGYDVRYVRPTSDLSNEKLDFGAVLDVRKDGKRVALLRPSRSYFPSQDASMGPIGRFFRGESTSEVGLRSGLCARHLDGDAAGPAGAERADPRGQPALRRRRAARCRRSLIAALSPALPATRRPRRPSA